MKKSTTMSWAVALLIGGAMVFTSCKDKNAAKGQLLEVYDVQGSSAKAHHTPPRVDLLPLSCPYTR